MTEQQRQQILASKEFNDLMDNSLKDLKVPFDAFQDEGYVRCILDKILDKCPFLALKMNEEAYAMLCTQDFGFMSAPIAQKAIELMLSSRPVDLFEVIETGDKLPNDEYAVIPIKPQYLELVTVMIAHNIAINGVVDPIREAHMETVFKMFMAEAEQAEKQRLKEKKALPTPSYKTRK